MQDISTIKFLQLHSAAVLLKKSVVLSLHFFSSGLIIDYQDASKQCDQAK